MAEKGKADIKQIREFFGGIPAKELIRLRKNEDGSVAEGVAYPTAYDDIAYGIGDGSLTYPDSRV
ncbi:MAG: hypothetical protein ACREHG_00085 [Candidatus Saccharimonadales bacterium]